jgi:hypothetical protein
MPRMAMISRDERKNLQALEILISPEEEIKEAHPVTSGCVKHPNSEILHLLCS